MPMLIVWCWCCKTSEWRNKALSVTKLNAVKPLVSFILVTYNQEEFVEEAVRAALVQTYSPLEIIVSDDASIDQTYEVAKAVVDAYEGPHRVIVRRNERNMGINPHFNLAVNGARGGFVVVAAGDDVSLPERTDRLVKAWQAGASAVFSNAELIDIRGQSKGLMVQPGFKNLPDWRGMVVRGTHSSWGCTLSWEKRVFDVFGDMQENIVGEDAVVPFRSSLLNGVAYIDEPLVRYRDRGENVSFWAKEKGLGRAEMIALGCHIMQFKMQMYSNWKNDLDAACGYGIISGSELEWGTRVLHEDTLIARKMEDLLKCGFLAAIFLMPIWIVYLSARMARFVGPIVSVKRTTWNMLNGVVHYRAPRMHRVIRRLLGRNL